MLEPYILSEGVSVQDARCCGIVSLEEFCSQFHKWRAISTAHSKMFLLNTLVGVEIAK